MSKMLPSVSVIVPAHNAEKGLSRLMASLRAQSYPSDRIEILLVDNKSTDRTIEVIAGFPDATGLSFSKWPSSYASRNVGIEHATGEVLAFIDADCWAHPDWVRIGVATLMEQSLDRVAGRVEFALSEYPNFYEIFDSARNFGQPDFVDRGWSGAGNLFVRREVFEDVGPWDAQLISGGDCEFGLRATRAGKSLGYAPECVIYHYARRSAWSLIKKWIRTEYGAAQVYRRHGLLGLHLWCKKANYRPLIGEWKSFPPDVRKSFRMRLGIDVFSNVLRMAGNLGNFLGYWATPRGNA